jgi:hypothetical protein
LFWWLLSCWQSWCSLGYGNAAEPSLCARSLPLQQRSVEVRQLLEIDPHAFKWHRALVAWLLIIFLESVHGVLRQTFLAPSLGDLPSRQLGVFVGSVLIFAVALATTRWLGAASTRTLLTVGGVWVLLTLVFEVGLGFALGVSTERLLSDYKLTEGGYLGLGLLFMLLSPWLARRMRGQQT